MMNPRGLNEIAGVAFIPPNSLLCVLPASFLRTHHTSHHVCIGKQPFVISYKLIIFQIIRIEKREGQFLKRHRISMITTSRSFA